MTKEIKDLSDVAGRTIYGSLKSAFAAITAIREVITETDSVEFVINGMDSEGNVNPEAYPEGYNVMVSKLTTKEQVGVDKDTQKAIYGQVPYAIVCWPFPTLDQVLANDAGRKMVESSMETELAHRIHRPIRRTDSNVDESVLTLAEGMVITIDELANLTRSATGGKLAPFDALYKAVSDKLKQVSEAFAKAKIAKTDFRKCLESQAYANHYYPALEEHKLFAVSLGAMIDIAGKSDPIIDSSWFSDQLAGREAKAFAVEESELSLDSLLGAFGDDSEANDEAEEVEASE